MTAIMDGLYGNGQSFFDAMAYHMSRMQTNTVFTAMNQLSNHDHSRFLTRTNQVVGRIGNMGPERASENVKKCVMREAVMIQMTWPGAPTLYYGDEAGVCGWTDPDSRRTYPWGREDLELMEFHRYMAGIHKRLPALRKGAVKPLFAANQQIAYGRMWGKYQTVTIISNLPQPTTMEIPVWQLGVTDEDILGRPILTTEEGYNAGILFYYVKGWHFESENACLQRCCIYFSSGRFLSSVKIQICGGRGRSERKERPEAVRTGIDS